MVYRLTLAYNGAAYAGWQRQNNALSIQQVVEEALSDLVGEAVRVAASGRTDAGVHALGQVAHFHLESGEEHLFPLTGLVHGTNHRLPSDIRVRAAAWMPAGFHARKKTLGKVYLYRLYRGRVIPPLQALMTMGVPTDLDLSAMHAALRALPGRHDFSAFALAGGSHKQPFRRLYGAVLEEHDREVHLRFFGEGFLRGMVRSLVGTLIEVGRGRRTPENLAELLAGRPREEAGPTAEAKGLTLEKVFYPTRWQPLEIYEP